ncbi:glycoside hydrolase family 43 protein [Flavobacterium psychrotrophum]|uniref:glycoside hydrolase family 43 protein n=1 Tax=Flavobacterium psychrotrophum TaxID=2294119 RepID=UPI0019690D87|nr:glycoside hydrolase family 43 protein [Flavobacterium psychrotrophum]
MKIFIAKTVLLLTFSTGLYAQDNIAAPAIAGDFADPSIIHAGKAYYAVGTSSEWAPYFPIYTSNDLKKWTLKSYAFDTLPEWASSSFWAPEYFYHNNTYYIYYTARRKSDNVSCIGVATSKYPYRGFTDRGIVVAYGKEAIDGFVYNDNGQLYITFKAYGLDNRPIELLGSKLNSDGLKMEGEIFSLLKDDERIGMEGQSILKHNGVYYLFYAAGGCCGGGCSYEVRVARSENITGPFEKYKGSPLLQESEQWKCPGHGTFTTDDNSQMFYLHHAYNKKSIVFTGRQGLLSKLSWNEKEGWPVLTATPFKNTPDKGFSDSFGSKKLNPYWQYDFRHATPIIKQKDGKLTLTGSSKEGNLSGIALTVRPESDIFEMEATVTNYNNALKGLVFYGDANAAIGVGITGNNITFWKVKDNIYSEIESGSINTKNPTQLKLITSPDHTCKAFYKDENKWIELSSSTSIDFLPQWDRSPRAGLHFKGDVNEEAVFDTFSVKYN